MRRKIIVRKIFIAVLLMFVATLATLLCRQFSLTPDRPSPEFRTAGPKNAQIQIYEYTDFACPSCRNVHTHLEQLLSVYKDSVRVNFKHYPLMLIHPWSFTAAMSADCAGEQGRFKDYSALLFENQAAWAQSKTIPGQFNEYAKKLNLDMQTFDICMAKQETMRRVTLDVAEGDIRGVNATPSFFINGKRAVGSEQFLNMARQFDNLLQKQKPR